MEQANILVVDDDKEIVNGIKKLLENEGYFVETAYNGMDALDIVSARKVDLILLDVMMPKLDGLSATMKIREERNIPILILSAKTEDSDKVLGLSMGADDYISKPFSPPELVARVKSHLRRYIYLGNRDTKPNPNVLTVGGLSMNTETKEVFVDGEPVKLTATEYKILQLLMGSPGRVYASEEIYSKVWNEEAYSVENTVMVHIRRIREKIEINPKMPKYLKVVWGIGYKIEKIN